MRGFPVASAVIWLRVSAALVRAYTRNKHGFRKKITTFSGNNAVMVPKTNLPACILTPSFTTQLPCYIPVFVLSEETDD